MKEFCVDTSGFSTPLANVPEDIYGPIWTSVQDCILAGRIAITFEIYEEMKLIDGSTGDCIRGNRNLILLEIQDGNWDFAAYSMQVSRLQVTYQNFISEFNNNIRNTVGLNDISIIALAKALEVPLVSSETPATSSPKRRKIPDICLEEGIEHLDFNGFLRRAGITLAM